MSFRMRWWMWAVLAMLLLAGFAAALRMHGTITLAATQADVHARSLPGLEDFLAAAPPVDTERQARLARLIRTGGWADNLPYLPFRELREQRPSQRDHERVLAAQTAGRPTIAELEAILDDGPVYLGQLGWLPRDAARLHQMSPQKIWRDTPAMLMGPRSWMNWYGIEACGEGDPEPFLRRIDQIHGSARHTACLLDSMVAIAIAAMRDQVYVWLASRGRLPEAYLDAWLAEDPPQVAFMRSGLAGERLIGPSQLQAMDWDELCVCVDPVATPHVAPSWQGRGRGVAAWLMLGHEMAIGIDAIAVQEEFLAGLPARQPMRMPLGIPSLLGNDFAFSLESLLTGYEAAYAHRFNRLVATCAAAYRHGEPLPEDETALAARVPAGLLAAHSPNEPAIRYERLSLARFRLGMDPAATKPPVVPASRWSAATVGWTGYGTTIGQPAVTHPYAWMRWSVEVDLDAILIPPPERPAKKPGKPSP